MQRTSDVLGVILVHGLWHGGWVWDAVRRDLDRAGVVSRVVELPMIDLASDITVTRRALDEFDRPAVLVGHSYGGAVTTGAGTHPHVRRRARADRGRGGGPTGAGGSSGLQRCA